MEGERNDEERIFAQVYPLIQPRPAPACDQDKTYPTKLIVLVFFRSALFERTIRWACQQRNWPAR